MPVPPEKVAHRISVRDDRIIAVLPNSDAFHIVHLGGLVFTTDEDPTARITFSITRESEVLEHLQIQGQVITFRRSR